MWLFSSVTLIYEIITIITQTLVSVFVSSQKLLKSPQLTLDP